MMLTAALVLVYPEVAAAQSAPRQEKPVSADAEKRASALVEEAKPLYLSGKYREARELLLSAWALSPTFDVAYRLGITEYMLEKHREAAQYLSYALKHWPQMGTLARQKKNVEQLFSESRAQVGAITVTVGTAEAEVLIDGQVVGRSPLDGEVFVEPGEHLVEARLEGYVPAKQTVKVDKGATAEVALAMMPMTSESAGVALAGAGAPWVPLVEGQPGAPMKPAPPPEKRSWVPVIALGAASVVGLGVGVGLTVASRSARDDADAQRAAILSSGPGCVNAPSDVASACGAFEETTSRAGAFGAGAIVAYAASGALAAGALVYALWPRSLAMSSSVGVRPTTHIAKDGAVLGIVGAW